MPRWLEQPLPSRSRSNVRRAASHSSLGAVERHAVGELVESLNRTSPLAFKFSIHSDGSTWLTSASDSASRSWMSGSSS